MQQIVVLFLGVVCKPRVKEWNLANKESVVMERDDHIFDEK